jgi:GAF domain-containing protein/HAMP domain-containing protein
MPEQLKSRAQLLKRVILIGLVFAIAGIIADVGDYYRTQDWRTLLDAVIVVLSIVCLFIARRMVQRDKLDAAGYWVLIAAWMGLGLGELIWEDQVWFITSVAFLILLVGSLVLPRKWVVWLAFSALYVLFVVLVNRFEPLPRREVIQSSEQLILHIIATVLLGVALLWQYAIAREHLQTIRARLLIAFVPLVLLLAAVIGGSSFLVSRNQVRRQVENQLKSVVALKEAEIHSWVSNLHLNLNLAATEEQMPKNLKNILHPEQVEPSVYEETYSKMQDRLNWAVEQMGLFEEMFVLNLDGRVILSTNPTQEGKIYIRESYFQLGLEGPYVQPPSYSPSLGETSVMSARPLRDEAGNTIALLVGRADMEVLNAIMLERAGLGETGETYLVGTNYALLTQSRFEEEGRVYVRTAGANAAIDDHVDGSGQYQGYRDVPVVGVYRWLPDLEVALMAEQATDEAYQGVTRVLLIDAGIATGAVLIVIVISIMLTNNIVRPMGRLAQTAQKIAAGDRERVAVVEREDEIGTLAQAFNSMTHQLRDLIDNLEQRVESRTQELERRSAYLEASAEVSRAASSILDRDRLVQDVVELIRERLDLYYVGLFVVDPEKEWAVLQAGTGKAGRKMMAEGHRLRVGGDSMIGQCVARSESRIALDVGDEAARFDNPHLPETRSEGALPLRSRGEVLGALTIQSTEQAAFDADALMLLQTMADQVAVALDNARLFADTEQALEAERRAYGELSREAWIELLRTRTLGYDYEGASITQARGDWTPSMRKAEQTGQIVQVNGDTEPALSIPLKVRDHVVGVMNFCKDEPGQAWTSEERALLEALTDELSQALESARLYEDTQRRAARERLTGEITAHMRETLDMDTVLRTAVRELGETLNLHDVTVQLDVDEDGADSA